MQLAVVAVLLLLLISGSSWMVDALTLQQHRPAAARVGPPSTTTSLVVAHHELSSTLRAATSRNDARITSTAPTARLSRTMLAMSDRTSSNDDDELSKLIDKRSQIKRKKKVDDAPNEALLEPTVDLDLDSLPAFKTERPVRRARSSDSEVGEDETSNNQKKKETAAAAPIVDYMADYDDENEWHIPNRLVASSSAWGDPNQHFVLTTTSKLTKRMQKAGKFVAGDVVLGVTELWHGGIVAVETSPAYGELSRRQQQSALDILQKCLQQQKDDESGCPEPQLLVQMDASVSTKFQTLLRPGTSMVTSLEQTLRVLGESMVTLFLAPHIPYAPTRRLAAGLASQIESGQAEYVGVTGIRSASTLRRLCRHLQDRECTLTAAAFPLALTHKNPKRGQELIAACKLLNVVPLILDPLDGGLASGVYTATNPSGGQLSGATTTKFSFAQLEKLQPLHSVLETVAQRVQTRVRRQLRDTQERFKSKYGPPPQINTDITTTQIALQWVVAKGGVPITPVNNPAQAKELLGCLGWTLVDEEVRQLDDAAALCRL